MNGPNVKDLALLLPELILVCTALALILAARRIQKTPWAAALTVLAAVAAALASAWLLSGGSKTGFGGMITVDAYSQFFKVLIASALALVTLLSVTADRPSRPDPRTHRPKDPQTHRPKPRPAEYHALLLLASTGMMFAASAVDLLILYLGLELATLCSYILVGITVEKPTSNEAAIKYFLLGSFASALLLYGIALAYGATGATDYAAIASAFSSRGPGSHRILLAAIGLLAAGLAFKIAAFPFHAWAPDAYQGASTPVAAFLATASKAAGLAALGRVCLVAFAAEARVLSSVLAGLAGLSIIVGSIMALSQTDMKRLLAYSSIAHAGYALLGFVSGTPEGAEATMTYVFLYVFMTLGAFGVVIALGQRGESLNGYQGLAAQRPGTAALMLLFLLSLTGIPPTAGFTAKFVVILSIVRAGHLALAVLAVVCSVVWAFVYLRVAVLMYMKEPQEPAPSYFSVAVYTALAVAALVTIIGGIFPGSLATWVVSP
ncbi:MAG: NADH-quinone oxidoreductase subunit N [Planctomycetes bacterium]|nr:NADH-quinone oxidoreductase subunit N [Planctomycetota bacterium]